MEHHERMLRIDGQIALAIGPDYETCRHATELLRRMGARATVCCSPNSQSPNGELSVVREKDCARDSCCAGACDDEAIEAERSGGDVPCVFESSDVPAVAEQWSPQLTDAAEDPGVPTRPRYAAETPMSDLESCVAAIVERFGRLDIVVTFPDVPSGRSVAARSGSERAVQGALDFEATVFDTYRFVPVVTHMMRARRHGKVITVIPGSLESLYEVYGIGESGIRSAMASYTRFIAHDLARDGITANGIAPGMGAAEHWLASHVATQNPPGPNRLSGDVTYRTTPTLPQRDPAPSQAGANAYLGVLEFLASPRSDYVTGEVLLVGGHHSAAYCP